MLDALPQLASNGIGKKFAAVIGFETEDDAKKAAPLIKKAGKSRGPDTA
jgi:hypothetical protein